MRFSLLSALLLTVIVGLSLTVGFQYYEISRLEKSLAVSEKLAGQFEVVFPDKVYARELECNIPDAWRFRIHVPENSNLKMYIGLYFGGDNHQSNFRSSTGESLDPGQYVVTCHLEYRGEDRSKRDDRNYAKGVWFGCIKSIESVEHGHGGITSMNHYDPFFDTIYTGEYRNMKRDGYYLEGKMLTEDPHGELLIYEPNEERVLPLVFFPEGVDARNPRNTGEKVGAAIWIGWGPKYLDPKPKKTP